jgi:hypothetical protein
MPVQHTIAPWAGWSQVAHLTNGTLELRIPLEVGIRISWLGFVGGSNQFAELADQLGKTGGAEWRIYGGTRLWHAPETMERTYSLDNAPIHYEAQPAGCALTQPTDHAGITKQVIIAMHDTEASVRVTYRLTNNNLWPVELAPWALNVMAPGGTAIAPLPPRGSHDQDVLPNTRLTLWSYSDMADPRWRWGREYIMLSQDSQAAVPQKFGLANQQGWAAYWNAGTLFVDRAKYIQGAQYPDYGCSYEFFTNFAFLEVESLGPLQTLQPGQTAEHAEDWALFRDVPQPRTEDDIRAHIVPLINRL